GKFKIGGVGFGPVTGSLLAGVLIGNFWHVPVSDTAKSLLFLMFMYGIGFSAGPGFVRGVRDGGWRWVALARPARASQGMRASSCLSAD
ncbi:hypothetical protein ACFQ2A_05745, partial [Variovorax dokdonensis]